MPRITPAPPERRAPRTGTRSPQPLTATTLALQQWWWGTPADGRDPAQPLLCRHPVQRRAIQNSIAALEPPAAEPTAMARKPRRRVSLPASVGPVRVMLALMVWQLFNRADAPASPEAAPPRFTQHFIAVARSPLVNERLHDVFRGPPVAGAADARDFPLADVARLARLLVPAARCNELLGFVRHSVCPGAQIEHHGGASRGVIAIANGHQEALACLARWPDALVFDDERAHPPIAQGDGIGHAVWRQHMARRASARDGCGLQVVFTDTGPLAQAQRVLSGQWWPASGGE